MAGSSEKVMIKDTRFIFHTNFRGLETEFNKNGYKEFNIVLPEDIGRDLIDRGWNVKILPPREEGDEELMHLPVRINFDSAYPPRVWLINAENGKRTMLDDETIGQLDFLSRDEIERVNIVVNPRTWSLRGNSGIKAYCNSMQVYFLPDPFEAEYEAEFGGADAESDDIPF